MNAKHKPRYSHTDEHGHPICTCGKRIESGARFGTWRHR